MSHPIIIDIGNFNCKNILQNICKIFQSIYVRNNIKEIESKKILREQENSNASVIDQSTLDVRIMNSKHIAYNMGYMYKKMIMSKEVDIDLGYLSDQLSPVTSMDETTQTECTKYNMKWIQCNVIDEGQDLNGKFAFSEPRYIDSKRNCTVTQISSTDQSITQLASIDIPIVSSRAGNYNRNSCNSCWIFKNVSTCEICNRVNVSRRDLLDKVSENLVSVEEGTRNS